MQAVRRRRYTEHEGPVKAILHTRYGAPDLLQLKEVDKPTPKGNEVLIAIHATTVSTADCNMRNFTFVTKSMRPFAKLMFWYRKALESTCPRHRVGRRGGERWQRREEI